MKREQLQGELSSSSWSCWHAAGNRPWRSYELLDLSQGRFRIPMELSFRMREWS